MTTVQTYFVEEVKQLVTDEKDLSQWLELVEKMGLSGQAALSYDGEKSPIPFYHMKSAIIQTFQTLCNREIDYKSFSITPIPLEVLELLGLCEKEKYFSRIMIRWDDVSVDPVVIGFVGSWSECTYYNDSAKQLEGQTFSSEENVKMAGGNHPTYSVKDQYLIARWGDENKSFEELMELAKKKYIIKTKAEAGQQILNAQRLIEDAEGNAFRLFGI